MAQLIPSSPLMQPLNVTFSNPELHIVKMTWGEVEILPEHINAVLNLLALYNDLAERAMSTNSNEELSDLRHKVYSLISNKMRSSAGDENGIGVLLGIQRLIEFRIGRRKRNNPHSSPEKMMYTKFEKAPEKYIVGATIVKDAFKGDSRPDFVLDVHGERCVAEFKATNFRKRHLYQLLEYVDKYNAKRGYAVAPSLGCDLPSHVVFVKMF